MQPLFAKSHNPDRPSHAPPPPPIAAPVLRDETAGDMQRLAAEIDDVLSGRVRSRSRFAQLRPPVGSGVETSFVDLNAERHLSLSGGGTEAAERAASWLGRAKRERRFERLRSAFSWFVAVGVAVGLVTVAVLLVSGRMPYLDNIERAVRILSL